MGRLKILYKHTVHRSEPIAMPNQYRQNYTPTRPLPQWLRRIISWL